MTTKPPALSPRDVASLAIGGALLATGLHQSWRSSGRRSRLVSGPVPTLAAIAGVATLGYTFVRLMGGVISERIAEYRRSRTTEHPDPTTSEVTSTPG